MMDNAIKEVIMEPNPHVLILTAVIACSIVLISGVIWIHYIRKGDEYVSYVVGKWVSIIWVIVLIATVFMSCLLVNVIQVPSDRYRYTVKFDTIEDLEEALDTYTFIEYKDGYFIFEDKKND